MYEVSIYIISLPDSSKYIGLNRDIYSHDVSQIITCSVNFRENK